MSLTKSALPVIILFLTTGQAGLAQQKDYTYTPVPFNEVRITDSFWGPRIETNRNVTIPFALEKCRSTGRLDNFKVASQVNSGDIATGKFCSLYGYDDSDVYKIIEGAAYSLTSYPDPALEATLDSLIADIAGAQESDGYIYTMRSINPAKSWAKERWVNDRYNGSHELYNAGHMYEAAVAYFYATGKRSLLDVAVKNADLLCKTFGPGREHIASGHQEIEIGLAKLYRVTGEKKYLALAQFLLDERGKGPKAGSTYTQDHQPVVDQSEAVGHAVRATYMYSAMADIAALTGNKSYISAIDTIWEDVVTKKTYITGGIGARAQGEAYGDAFELPNLTAYNETCAAIANVFWNHRMFLLHGESKYYDVLERTLYNGLLSGISLDGTKFFYPNPLASDGDYERSEWFDCSCCPSNVTRFISSLSGYIYATRGDSVFVNLFIGNRGNIKLPSGDIVVSQTTSLPWQGIVTLNVEAKRGQSFQLCLRIPGWARNSVLPGELYRYAGNDLSGVSLSVNGKLFPIHWNNGYAVIDRSWKNGDVVELKLPVAVRKVVANAAVENDRDCYALECGPIVYCAEGIDNDGKVDNIIIPSGSGFSYTYQQDLLNGIGLIGCEALKLAGDGYERPVSRTPCIFRAIPYYAWCHRGKGEMKVWFYSDDYVFPPLLKPQRSLFTDNITVAMKDYEGQKIAWSSGDEYPSLLTGAYTGPVTLTETNTVNAIAFNASGKPSVLVSGEFIKTTLAPAMTIKEPLPGLRYRYFEGRFRKLPDFDKERVVKSGIIKGFDVVSERDTADAYGMVFEGFIDIPARGVYTFYVVSDDGSRFVIDGKEIVINDGLHEMNEKSGQAALEKGFHAVRAEFFDYGAGEGLEIWYSGPGIGKVRLPDDILFRSATHD